MHIAEAQHELRTRFVGGFYGQLVSGVLWLSSAMLSTVASPHLGIIALVVGGFFIFPVTELLLRTVSKRAPLSSDNALQQLGMQVAFVLPLSMPLLLPVSLYKLHWFFPAMMVLVGAHYLPFAFLYGMRQFVVLAGLLVTCGLLIARFATESFSIGAWITGGILLVFAVLGLWSVRAEQRQ